MNKETSFKEKVNIRMIVLAVVVGLFCASKVGYYLVCKNAISEVEKINLPPNCEIFYPTTACVSDIYNVHVRAENIVYCEEGKEYLEQYVKDNNPESSLEKIKIYGVTGESDTAIINFFRLPREDQDTIVDNGEDKYAHIVYYNKKHWFPILWYNYEKVVAD